MANDVIRLKKETIKALDQFRKNLCLISTLEPSVYTDMSYSDLIRIAILYADTFILINRKNN